MTDISSRWHLVRHGVGFLVSGGAAFCTDALVLEILSHWVGIDPLLARLASISVAMVVGWLSHRRLTFALQVPPTLPEFLRYAGVAWFSSAVNYVVFATLLVLLPDIPMFVAFVLAAAVQMFVSYVGMRFGAFRKPSA